MGGQRSDETDLAARLRRANSAEEGLAILEAEGLLGRPSSADPAPAVLTPGQARDLAELLGESHGTRDFIESVRTVVLVGYEPDTTGDQRKRLKRIVGRLEAGKRIKADDARDTASSLARYVEAELAAGTPAERIWEQVNGIAGAAAQEMGTIKPRRRDYHKLIRALAVHFIRCGFQLEVGRNTLFVRAVEVIVRGLRGWPVPDAEVRRRTPKYYDHGKWLLERIKAALPAAELAAAKRTGESLRVPYTNEKYPE